MATKMPKHFSIVIFCFLLISISFSKSYSESAESSIVSGTAAFLTERANDNFLYIFEKKIKDNPLLKKFFPNTFEVLETTSLKTLLTSKDVWDKSMKEDLSDIGKSSLSIIDSGVKVLPSNELESTGYILDNIYGISVAFGNDTLALNAMPIRPTEEQRHVYDSIYPKLQNMVNAFGELRAFSFGGFENKDSVGIVLSDIVSSLKEVKGIFNSRDYKLLNANTFSKSIDSLNNVVSDLKKISDYVRLITDAKSGNTYKALNVFNLIKYVKEKLPENSFVSKDIRSDYDSYFDGFKSYVLFFAQLSEAESKDEVKSILSSAMLPPVSFSTKREDAGHFFLSSYWGLGGGIESMHKTLDFKKENTLGYYGITTPIGIEYSRGSKGNGSISMFISILDFAPAVNSQLFNSNSEVRLNDLVSPGIYLVYGVPEIPVAISLGYFHSKSVEADTSPQHHIILSIVFDMPLMIFY